MLLHEVVERKTDEGSGNASQDDLAPQAPRGGAPLRSLARRERVEVVEVHHDDGQNGTQLNDNEEHVPELLGDVELDELVDENHVARRGHRQPLGDALDEAKERRF